MKKLEIILFIFIGLLALLVIFSAIFFSGQKKEIQTTPSPITVYVPSPSPTPFVNVPEEMKIEQQKQENYAEEREVFLRNRPWFLKLPLQSDNYFVSYNPETDTLIVEVYYVEKSNTDKAQQLDSAKRSALIAISNIGIDTTKQKIQYLELLKQ